MKFGFPHRLLAQQILSSSNLMELIERHKTILRRRFPEPGHGREVERIRKQIKLENGQGQLRQT